MKMIAGAIVVLAGAMLGSSALLAVAFGKGNDAHLHSELGVLGAIILALLGLFILHRGERETKQ